MSEPSAQPIPVQIGVELTPNPDALKFIVQPPLFDSGTFYFSDAASAQGSLLPENLFAVQGVAEVLLGPDFISITKTPQKKWDPMIPSLFEVMKSTLESRAPFLKPELTPASGAGDQSEMEQKIQIILDKEVRPAVARDGGDVVFIGYDDGVVKLRLRGSCSTCPSSMMTLKLGIETRLKSLIPEIREVIQIA